MGPVHRGGTTGNLGLTWGWRTLSPQWRGLWGGETPSTHPLDYGTAFMEKVVVILTDGNNQFHDQDSHTSTPASDWTAYGRIEAVPGVNSGSSAADRRAQGRAVLDTRMADTCAAMKTAGIRIYSITFGGSPDPTAQALFRACATTPAMYWHAPMRRRCRRPSAPSAASSPTCASWSRPMRRRFPIPRLRRGDSGATGVEFALVLPLMILVIVGGLEIAIVSSSDRASRRR